jgi:hypothetical protein
MFREVHRLSELCGLRSLAGVIAKLRHATLLAPILCVVIVSASHATGRGCGLTPRIDGVRYDVREIRGALPCPAVRRVVTTFIRNGTVSSKWLCTRGHGSSPFAASCAAGKNVLIRVYAPS